MRNADDWTPVRLRRAFFSGAVLAAIVVQPVAAQNPAARQSPELRQDNPGFGEKAPSRQAAGSSTVALTTSMAVLNDSVKLGSGDRVSFRIVEERRDPIALYVTDSGEMEVPLIGRVKADGKTCKQLAFEIKPLLEKDYFIRATVIIGLDVIGAKSRGKVYITGQVRSQGVMEILPDDPGFSVSRAILRAGGLGDFADKRKVKLIRKKEGAGTAGAQQQNNPASTSWWKRWRGKNKPVEDDSTETIYVDLVEILEKGHLEKDPVLKPGDLIVVPDRLFNF
jgi:protein involved in polysaccharide export with SLBB domain